MARLEDIRDLAEAHASSISSSPRDWMNYLDTAARLYRYPFMDQLLIHAQRPQATACASLELWNQKMFRWVNRGAKGIALIDETTQKTRLRYVFDVQDTHMVNGGRTPYLWKLQEEQQEEVLLHLEEVYGLEAKDTKNLSDALMATARYMVEENLEEYLDGLLYVTGQKGFAFQMKPDPYDFEMYLWSNGTAYCDEDGQMAGQIDSKESQEVFKMFQDMEKDGYPGAR